MALIADYTHIEQIVSETETFEDDITYPADLPEEHPHYEKRGQTITETFPVVTQNETLYQSAYIVIGHYNMYKFWVNDLGETLIDIQYYVYENKDAYLADQESYLFEDSTIGQYHLITSEEDLRVKGYEILKNQTHITNTIDD